MPHRTRAWAIMDGSEGEALTPPSASHRGARERGWSLIRGCSHSETIEASTAGGGAVQSEPPPSTPQCRWCVVRVASWDLLVRRVLVTQETLARPRATARWHGHVAHGQIARPRGTARWASAVQPMCGATHDSRLAAASARSTVSRSLRSSSSSAISALMSTYFRVSISMPGPNMPMPRASISSTTGSS